MSVLERVARLGDRLFDRARHPGSFTLSEESAVDGELTSLRGSRYALLVTFRSDGTAVPSPVWCAIDDAGRGYVKTAADVGKVKRIRRDSRVLIAPCTARGKPTATAVRATARLLPPVEWPHAEETLASAYGLTRRAAEAVLSAGAAAYLELVPRSGNPWPPDA